MKNLILLFGLLLFVGCGNNQTQTVQEPVAAVVETDAQFVQRMADKGVEIKKIEISEDLQKRIDALNEAYEKAGGASKYQEAEQFNHQMIEDYIQQPSQEKINAILSYMKETKIALNTTHGLIYDSEKIEKILKKAVDLK